MLLLPQACILTAVDDIFLLSFHLPYPALLSVTVSLMMVIMDGCGRLISFSTAVCDTTLFLLQRVFHHQVVDAWRIRCD